MDRPNASIDWTQVRDRWLDFVQRVHAQWPEIELGVIQATLGHRDRLIRAVADTYGLDSVDADRAVSIWESSHVEGLDRSEPPASRGFA